MALIKCPECGKEISDKAISCPGCGAPSKEAKAPAYQLDVPHRAYSSSAGTYLRVLSWFAWIGGAICSFVLSTVGYTYRGYSAGYGYSIGVTFNFWILLLCLVFFLILGLIPYCFAQFFDDVHTIRYTLQGMTLRQDKQEKKTLVVDGKYVCSNCGKHYAKYYDSCPECGQER